MRGTVLLATFFAFLPATLVAQKKVDFVKDIAPILVKRCVECHSGDEPEGDYSVDKKSALFPQDKDDWSIIPGKPNDEGNEFFIRITLDADDPDIMPAEGKPLTKKQIATIKQWIVEGANWPANGDAAIKKLMAADKPKVEKLDIAKPNAAQKAAEDKAIAAIEKAGGLAMRVAANTHATEVNFSLVGKKVQNQQVALASNLAGTLTRLNLARTKIDDGALATVGKFGKLRWLNLSNTGVTDAGLKSLAGLKDLRYLNLYGTKVTDAGLAHLKGLTNLQNLYLWQTKATKAGAKSLKAALPKVSIDMGEYAAILAKVKPPAKKKPAPKKPKLVAINKTCPVTDRPAKPNCLSVVEGQAVALCCGKCKKKFDANPQQFLGKVKEFKVAKGPIANKKCPLNAKRGVNAKHTAGYQGKLIGFCCGKCKAKFAANPEQFAAKLAPVLSAPAKKKAQPKKQPRKKNAGRKRRPVDTKVANAKCPVSGRDVDPSKTSVFRRKTIGFCCGNCKAKFDAKPRSFVAKLKDVFPNAGKRRNRKNKK